jgi:hypothetical protein
MQLKIVTVSKKDNLEDTFLYQSIKNQPQLLQKVLFFGNNSTPLPKIYNKAIQQCINEKTDVAIFVHDDVYINCEDLIQRVSKYSEMYTVFGLAGTTSITVKEPVLWHLMSKRENLRGCVAHGTSENEYFYTSFGNLPNRVIMIDGVFIAINLKKLPKEITFDEQNPAGFHFYDLIFSLDCSLNRVSVGIGDVPIIHKSPGLQDISDDWKRGQEYFLNKYKKYIGKTLTV